MGGVLEELFSVEKPIIGMIHLKPLPGSPMGTVSVEEVFEAALRDAEALKSGGVDGVQVENMGDRPFLKPGKIGLEVVALVAAVAREVRTETGLPTGVFILANGVEESFSAAKASGAKWIRANMWAYAYMADEGYVEAAAPRALRHRSRIRADDVKVFADILVKHGSHALVSDISLGEHVRAVERYGADAVVVSGERTGAEVDEERVRLVKNAAERPVIIGSGITPGNVKRLLSIADGAIVGTWFKRDGVLWNPVDEERVRELMREVKKLR